MNYLSSLEMLLIVCVIIAIEKKVNKLETKIMFLIISLLIMYLIFTQRGREWLKRYAGLNIDDKERTQKEDLESTAPEQSKGMVRA
jgi:hypothetical protein